MSRSCYATLLDAHSLRSDGPAVTRVEDHKYKDKPFDLGASLGFELCLAFPTGLFANAILYLSSR